MLIKGVRRDIGYSAILADEYRQMCRALTDEADKK